MSRKLNQITVLLIGVFIFAMIIANGFVLQPFLKGSRRVAHQLSEERNKSAILGEISAIQNAMKAYEPQFIQKNQVSVIIQDLNQMAQKSGVALNSVTPGQVEVVGDYERVTFGLQAFGKYHLIGDFISRIESYQQFLKIQNLDVTTIIDNETKERVLKVVIRLAGYRPMVTV